MKYRNKIILILCAMVLALGLTACNNTADSSQGTTANPTEAAHNIPPKSIWQITYIRLWN